MVERAPALRTGGYVIDFWGRGYDIAERMGLPNAINRIGYYVRDSAYRGRPRQRVAGFGTRVFDELTGGRYVTLARSDLSRLLFAKIKDVTEIIFGDEIVGLKEQADAVRVHFKHSGERRFDLVIGADGLHSEFAGSPSDRNSNSRGNWATWWRRSTHGYRPHEDDVYIMHGQPGWMVGRFALHEDRTLFLFVFADDTASCRRSPNGRRQCCASGIATGNGNVRAFSTNWIARRSFISTASARSG